MDLNPRLASSISLLKLLREPQRLLEIYTLLERWEECQTKLLCALRSKYQKQGTIFKLGAICCGSLLCSSPIILPTPSVVALVGGTASLFAGYKYFSSLYENKSIEELSAENRVLSEQLYLKLKQIFDTITNLNAEFNEIVNHEFFRKVNELRSKIPVHLEEWELIHSQSDLPEEEFWNALIVSFQMLEQFHSKTEEFRKNILCFLNSQPLEINMSTENAETSFYLNLLCRLSEHLENIQKIKADLPQQTELYLKLLEKFCYLSSSKIEMGKFLNFASHLISTFSNPN